MVTFTNLASVRLPSLKFVGLRVRKIRRIQCVSCLSTTVSQLFEPQLQKVVIFKYPSFHFLFALGTPLWKSRKTLHELKSNSVLYCLPNPSQHVPIYLQQFSSYSNRKCKKSPFSRTAAHIFVSPGNAPAIITQYVAWMEKQFNACQTPRSMYLSQWVSPKIAIFTTFLFPLGTPLGQSRKTLHE